MRRKSSNSIRPKITDPRAQLNPIQLAHIGAVTLAWNYLEEGIDRAIKGALRLKETMAIEITSRINGIDGKIAILRQSARKTDQISEEHCAVILATLGAVEEHKRYRDGIIHARIVDRGIVVAPTSQRKGIVDEVLVSVEALDALYHRLIALQFEVWNIVEIFFLLEVKDLLGFPFFPEKKRQSNELNIQECLALHRKNLKNRLALPQLPRFPEESPTPPASGAPKAPQN